MRNKNGNCINYKKKKKTKGKIIDGNIRNLFRIFFYSDLFLDHHLNLIFSFELGNFFG